MSSYFEVPTPASREAGINASVFGLENHGLTRLHRVYWNLSTAALYEEAIFRGEARCAHLGPLIVTTGKHTARAAADKFIVREPSTEDKIWWGEYNRPFTPQNFNTLLTRLQAFLQGRDVFVQDCYAGADPDYHLPIRIITEKAWHSLFVRNMFIKLKGTDAMKRHVPEFTIIGAPSFNASPLIDSTRTETFIIANFAERLAIIGGSAYGGEIKKTIFTLLNFLMPNIGVMSMHCSANVGPEGDSAVFFGLSGTGKTTLSADPKRRLVGDDEHGWSDNGVFNYEDGCYAKVIRLSPAAEPQIYECTRRFGTIIENVVMDNTTRRLDLNDDRVTENTRAAYPLNYIDNALPAKMARHPNNIIFLTCDASGVMPPIARLSPDQAMYHFISGYTSKIAGTEIGLGTEPEITFSTCFGAPFMVHKPHVYAELLKSKILKHGAACWLVNTGWTGGPFGIGKRISIQYTRQLLNDALDGSLHDVKFRQDSVFGFEVPMHCEGIPDSLLDPAKAWPTPEEYYRKYDSLAARFIENFKLFAHECPPGLEAHGPKRVEIGAVLAK
jgi:phosphoenolpyruvate carboxykinase (ATP)